MAGARLGLNGTVNRNTGTYGSPVWAEVDLTRDVEETVEWDAAEAHTRQSRIKQYVKSMLEIGFDVTVRSDTTDAGFQALWDACVSSTGVLDLMILDGPTTEVGASGFRCDFQVFTASQPQNMDDVLYRTFNLKPSAAGTNPPTFAEVTGSGGTVTFTPIA